MITITYNGIDGIFSSLCFDETLAKPGLLTEFKYHQVENRQWWFLDSDWIYWTGKIIFRVRRGFGWNGASVPCGLQWFEKPGDHLAASLPHDSVSSYHWIEVWDVLRQVWICTWATRSFADRLFHNVNRVVYDIRDTKVYLLYSAVRLFGWWAWYTDVCYGKCKSCKGTVGIDCPYRDQVPTSFATEVLK